MSDIWHSAQEIPLFDDTVVFIDDLNNWHTGYTQRDNDGITDHDSGEIYTEENVLRWAYIKDLLALETELIRTRKALEAIRLHLMTAKGRFNLYDEYLVSGMDSPDVRFVKEEIDKALEQITALTKGGNNE